MYQFVVQMYALISKTVQNNEYCLHIAPHCTE